MTHKESISIIVITLGIERNETRKTLFSDHQIIINNNTLKGNYLNKDKNTLRREVTVITICVHGLTQLIKFVPQEHPAAPQRLNQVKTAIGKVDASLIKKMNGRAGETILKVIDAGQRGVSQTLQAVVLCRRFQAPTSTLPSLIKWLAKQELKDR